MRPAQAGEACRSLSASDVAESQLGQDLGQVGRKMGQDHGGRPAWGAPRPQVVRDKEQQKAKDGGPLSPARMGPPGPGCLWQGGLRTDVEASLQPRLDEGAG